MPCALYIKCTGWPLHIDMFLLVGIFLLARLLSASLQESSALMTISQPKRYSMDYILFGNGTSIQAEDEEEEDDDIVLSEEDELARPYDSYEEYIMEKVYPNLERKCCKPVTLSLISSLTIVMISSIIVYFIFYKHLI